MSDDDHDLLDIFALDEEEEEIEEIQHFNNSKNEKVEKNEKKLDNNDVNNISVNDIIIKSQIIESSSSKPSSYKNAFTSEIKPIDTSNISNLNKQSQNVISTERYTGWKLLNRSIGACELEQKLHGYNNIKLSDIAVKMDRGKINGFWCLFAVIVGYTALNTSKGEKYGVLKLSDWVNNISVFMFGKIYKDWKETNEGTIVCIANPTIRKDQNNGVGISLNLNSLQQVLIIGQSAEFGRCKSNTKDGKKCMQVINKSKSEFCSYHVKAAFSKLSSNRPNLHHSGMMKQFETKATAAPKDLSKGTYAFNQGKNAVYIDSGFNSVNKNMNRSADISNISSRSSLLLQAASKVSCDKTIKQIATSRTHYNIIKAATTPVMEIKLAPIKTIAWCNNLPVLVSRGSKMIELIKSKEVDVKPLKNVVIEPTCNDINCKNDNTFDSDIEFELDDDIDPGIKDFNSTLENIPSLLSPQLIIPKPASTKPIERKLFLNPSSNLISKNENIQPNTEKTIYKPDIKTDIKPQFRKFDPNNDIDASNLNRMRAQVIAKPLSKLSTLNPQKPTIQQDFKFPISIQPNIFPVITATTSTPASLTILNKRTCSTAFGIIETDKIKDIVNMTSTHENLVENVENEILNAKLGFLETKDKMLDQMSSVKHIDVKVYFCTICKDGFHEKKPFKCVQENHDLSKAYMKKRFFRCSNCNTHTTSFEKRPNKTCKSCGHNIFNEASMFKGKELAENPSEELKVRGNEHAFSLRNEY